MKSLYTLTFFTFLFFNNLFSQIIKTSIYNISTPQPAYTIAENDYGTNILSLSDSSICIGGQIEYVTDPDGTQLRPAYRNFILKIDTSMNMLWNDYHGLFLDYNPDHNISALTKTTNGNIIYCTDTDLVGYPTLINNEGLNGNANWSQGPYADSANMLFKIAAGLCVSDTLLFSGKLLNNNGNGLVPLLFATDTNGNTLFSKSFSSFINNTGSTDFRIEQDQFGNLYLVFWSDINNRIVTILTIDTYGNVLQHHSIVLPVYNYFFISNSLVLGPNRFLFTIDSNYFTFQVFDSTGIAVDSFHAGCNISTFRSGLNGDFLALFESTASCNTSWPIGNYLFCFSSNCRLLWGVKTGSGINGISIADFIQSDDSTYFGVGTFSISNSSMVLCEKVRHPSGNRTLNYATSNLCSADSINISAFFSTSYLWSNGSTTQNIYVKSAGNYFVYLFDSIGNFVVSDTARISSSQNINLGSDTTVCNNDTIILDAGAGYLNYQWQNGDTSRWIFASTASSGVDSIYYSVQVLDSNNCTNIDSVLIVFDICANIVAPFSQPLRIYPTITSEILNVENAKINSKITIYDFRGLNIQTVNEEASNFFIDVKGLLPGMYFVRDGLGAVFRFIKL